MAVWQSAVQLQLDCAACMRGRTVLQRRASDEQAALGVEVEQRLQRGTHGEYRMQCVIGCFKSSLVLKHAVHCPDNLHTAGPAAAGNCCMGHTCQRWLFQFLIMCASSRIRYFHFLRLNMRASCFCDTAGRQQAGGVSNDAEAANLVDARVTPGPLQPTSHPLRPQSPVCSGLHIPTPPAGPACSW